MPKKFEIRTGEPEVNNGRLATNVRLLRILEIVSENRIALTPTQINQTLGLPKPSIHRLCQTLIDHGFLQRDTSGNGLVAGKRSFRMASGLIQSDTASIARRQVLLDLADKIGETINFVVPEPNGMTYLDRVESQWAFKIELPIGSRVPFHCTASGKCCLASLDRPERAKLLSCLIFDPRTANTLVSFEKLDEELRNVSEQGYAIDNQELFDGMMALAVPILSSEGQFIAALAFHGPTQRLDRQALLSHLDTIRDGASRLAQIVA